MVSGRPFQASSKIGLEGRSLVLTNPRNAESGSVATTLNTSSAARRPGSWTSRIVVECEKGLASRTRQRFEVAESRTGGRGRHDAETVSMVSVLGAAAA